MLISFLFFMIYCNVVHVVKNQKHETFKNVKLDVVCTWR